MFKGVVVLWVIWDVQNCESAVQALVGVAGGGPQKGQKKGLA